MRHGPNLLIIALALKVGGMLCAQEETTFRSPLFTKLEFPEWAAELSPEDKAGMIHTLLDFARNNPEAGGLEKAKALVLARSIDPENKEAFITSYQLSRGEDPGPFAIPGGATGPSTTFLSSAATKLESYGQSRSAQYADFLREMVTIIDSGVTTGEAPWDDLLGAPAARAKTSSALALSSTANHRSILSQVFILTTDGIHPIEATFENNQHNRFRFTADEQTGTAYLSSGFREGIKYLTLQNPGLIKGWHASFSTVLEKPDEFFEAQGPSATLGCLVSFHAATLGRDFDEENVAFAADVNADGTIQPLKDLRERLDLIGDSTVSLIGISYKDSLDAPDIMLRKGPGVFASYQIFAVKKLDEDALDLAVASTQRPESLQKAIDTFNEVKEVLTKPGGIKFLTNSHVRKRLQEVVQLAPNHVSAKTLLLASNGQLPSQFSLKASYELSLEPLSPLAADIRSGEFLKNPGKMDSVALGELQRFQKKLHPKLVGLNRALQRFDSAGRVGSNKTAARREAAGQVIDEVTALQRDPQIVEALK